jgi:hypothetical protein
MQLIKDIATIFPPVRRLRDSFRSVVKERDDALIENKKLNDERQNLLAERQNLLDSNSKKSVEEKKLTESWTARKNQLKERVRELELKLEENQSGTIKLDYTYDFSIRYGYEQKPNHQPLEKMFAAEHGFFENQLQELNDTADFFKTIPTVKDDSKVCEPNWNNGFLPPLDAMFICSFVVKNKPRHYLEIGSGNSTRFAAKTKAYFNLDTNLISIDPNPRVEIDSICDKVIRKPLEYVDLNEFSCLKAGDVVFFDGSHRSFQNSDVTAFFMDVLPMLPAGVIIGVHDICLPLDYPPGWEKRYYNEQYLLACYLLANPHFCKILMPAYYVSKVATSLKNKVSDLFAVSPLKKNECHGCAFWFVKN